MTTALLIVLNLQLAAVLYSVEREFRTSVRYRSQNLELQGDMLDVELLNELRLRRLVGNPVVTASRKHQKSEGQSNGSKVTHERSVTSGADRA